jgi:hypothetical protein
MRGKKWWWISFLAAFIFAGLVGIRWYLEDSAYQPNECQLTDELSAHKELMKKLEEAGYPSGANLELVPTGIFIQSLEFEDANDVNLTGYVWQRLDRSEFQNPPGVIFPEVVNSGGGIIPEIDNPAYSKIIGDRKVVGWYFEVTLRQTFNYKKFPLDHKTVWIRIWPRNFLDRNLLFPDYRAYRSTDFKDAFGIDEDIVLGNWKIEETYFDYHLPDYDTNFGIVESELNPKRFPELYFNIVLKRNFINEFIIYLIPLLTVAALLYLILLATTTEREKADRFDFSILGVIGVNSALFFVVIIAHIQLRQEFLGSGLVYLEYFYLVMYIVILLVTLDAYLISIGWQIRILNYGDHLIPKLIYWPVLFGTGAVITWLALYLLDVDAPIRCP